MPEGQRLRKGRQAAQPGFRDTGQASRSGWSAAAEGLSPRHSLHICPARSWEEGSIWNIRTQGVLELKGSSESL